MVMLHLGDKKPMYIPSMMSFYFSSQDDALNNTKWFFSKVFSEVYGTECKILGFDDDGFLEYSQKEKVGIFIKREKERTYCDPSVYVKNFKDGILLNIEILGDYGEIVPENLEIALFLKEKWD